MDPYDELWYRVLVGRVITSIERALNGPAEVFSYRVESAVPAWRLVDHRTAHRLRRQRGKELLHRESCKGIGTLDVRHYYPSVVPTALADVLAEASAAPGAVALICRFLEALPMLGMPHGLPIGAEASGVLGNAMLVGVDRALSSVAQGHVRYTDDSWVFLDDPASWGEVVARYGDAAGTVGLALNPNKVQFLAKEDGEADDVLSNGRVDSMIGLAGGFVPVEVAAEELEHQMSLPEPDWSTVRFSLGALARDRSAAGLDVLYSHPELFVEAPVNTADYLLALAADKKRRGRIDRDWLVDFATAPPDGRTVAARVHACRVVHRLRVGRDHGQRFEDVALSSARPRNVPLQAWAAAAWGTSEAHRPGTAVANATHVGELPIRRSFALTIDPERTSPTKCRKWATHLATVEPDLLPSVKRLRR